MKTYFVLFGVTVMSYTLGRLHSAYICNRRHARTYFDKTFQHLGHWTWKFPSNTWLQNRRIRNRLHAINPKIERI